MFVTDHPVMRHMEANLQSWGASGQLLHLSSEASSYWLDLQVPLSVDDSDALMGTLISDQGVSSNDEIVSGRISSVDRVEDEEVIDALEG